MMTGIDHNKLLKKIVKERLKPCGIFQKGQSRTFLYDKGWFTIVIEFQPSSWSKGTYLNVGVDFNFYPRDYFTFGYGYREKDFEEFKNEEQFSNSVNELCDLAIKRVEELEHKFQDIWTALKTLDKEKGDDIWRLYEIAVLNALTSNFDQSRNEFRELSKEKCEYDWQIKRKQVVDELINRIDDSPNFMEDIKNLINKTRELKKLPTITFDKLTERNTIPKSTLPKSGRMWLNKLFGN